MPDTIPLEGQNCPAWRQNTVRHAAGMLSAIIPESCPSWAGTRIQRIGETDLGTDGEWTAYLYESFISGMWRGTKPHGFEYKGQGERMTT